MPCRSQRLALGEPAGQPGTETHTNRGVLLVDDDDAVRSTTRRLIERHGWRVIEASEGEMALAMFVARRRDIAISAH